MFQPNRLWIICIGAILVLLPVEQVRSQVGQVSRTVEVPELNNNARNLLLQVEQSLNQGEWQDAIESIRRIDDDHGHELIRIDIPDEDNEKESESDQFVYYRDLRTYLQIQLSKIGRHQPKVLEVYREQVDPVARQIFEQAEASRDILQLKRVVHDYFLSSYGDKALLTLGDTYLEQGDYSTARFTWEQISPNLRTPEHDQKLLYASPGQPLWLAVDDLDWKSDHAKIKALLLESEPSYDHLSYPDSEIPMADILARFVLVSWIEGSARRAKVELELLNQLFPNASGVLVGKTVRYGEFLKTLITTPIAGNKSDYLTKHWPTFAGNFQRNAAASYQNVTELEKVWSTKTNIQIQPEFNPDSFQKKIAEDGSALLSYHPITIGNYLFLNDDKAVRALDKRTGQPAWRANLAEDSDNQLPGVFHRSRGASEPDIEMGIGFGRGRSRSRFSLKYTVGAPRFTLSSWENLLIARQGSTLTGMPTAALNLLRPADILVFNTSSEGKLVSVIPANEDTQKLWAFEGTGISDGTRLFTAMTKNGVRAESAVACFDIRSSRLLWRREICLTEPYGTGLVREGDVGDRSHNLLAMADKVLYYNTNRGAIAAVDSDSGKLLWETTYPRTELKLDSLHAVNIALQRDLNPCIVSHGLVIVMPADCDRIFALDAATGKKIWHTFPGVKAVHLLGTTQDNLIVSGEQLIWFDLHSGKFNSQFPGEQTVPANSEAASLPGYGRGIIVGETVLFPSRNAISILHTKLTEKGEVRIIKEAIDLTQFDTTGGNLIADEDMLFISAADKTTAFRWKKK
ncbi:MAG: hypothetical protein COA78_09330 [Blastopirellula sp.]|nr:MAG: hypothetical protein COA78_09330 [Blastopirellula sp.]